MYAGYKTFFPFSSVGPKPNFEMNYKYFRGLTYFGLPPATKYTRNAISKHINMDYFRIHCSPIGSCS